jgi:hypothetical protein
VSVKDHHIRPVLEYAPQSFRGVSGLDHDSHIRLIVEQSPQALPQEQEIMHQSASNGLQFPTLCVGAHSHSLSGPEKVGSGAGDCSLAESLRVIVSLAGRAVAAKI